MENSEIITSPPINGIVTEQLLSESCGLGIDALGHYRRSGKVTEGKHYIVAENKRIMWYVEEFNEWLRGSKYIKVGSGSGSTGKAKGGMKRQTSSQTLRV